MSRLILLLIFWVMLVMAVVTISVPEALRGSLWDMVGGFVEDTLANDLQKRDMAIRKSQKIMKNYVDLLKELYGTKFLMAEDAADLAERYAAMIGKAGQSNADSTSGVMVSYANLLQSQAATLGGLQGEEAVALTDDMIRNFRELERKLGERRTGREAYLLEIDKLAALKEIYAKGLEKAAMQQERIRALSEKIRVLNERISVVDRMNADNERLAVMHERMTTGMQAVQEKARASREELEAMREREAVQKDRMEAMQERINRQMGR